MAKQRQTTDDREDHPPPPLEAEVDTQSSGNGEAAPPSTGDIFDRLETLRQRQKFDKVKTKRSFTTCGIRKPRKDEWFQSHPLYRQELTLFEHKAGMSPEWYFPATEEVLAELERLSPTSLHNVCIFLLVNRKHESFVWPVRGADVNGRVNDFHASMYEMFTRIRRMKRQFAVVLLGFRYINQHVNLIRVEPSWRTRRVNRPMALSGSISTAG